MTGFARIIVPRSQCRIFLPFADDDPQGIDVLSRVLLLANDDKIRDPALAQALRQV